MMIVAVIMRPWLRMVKEMNVQPKVLADDVLIIAQGKGMLSKLANTLNATHVFLQDMGAKVAPTKSFNFASTSAGRKWVEETEWSAIGGAIPVLRDFRYLGAHLNTMGDRKAATLDHRFLKGVGHMRRVAHLKATPQTRAKIIRVKVYPGFFMG